MFFRTSDALVSISYIISDFWTSVLLIVWDSAGNFQEFFILERKFHQLQKEA